MGSTLVNTVNQIMNDAIGKGLVHHHTEGESLNGRTITIGQKEFLNFGSCCYMGLEQHSGLKNAVVESVNKFGTQFSSSRTYASIGLYQELEGLLEQVFEKPTVVTASTTLGHLATIPVIINEDDAVILDMQVHNSVQMAVQLLKAEGVSITVIRHNDMDMLESKIKELRNKHKKIWYFADGVYSMYGDYAPMAKLEHFMDTYEQFHLYIDDAHGMSWIGKNGCGYVRSQIAHHPKMVLAGSLNKSFATSGGFVVFPNEEMAQTVRNCGGTLIFCGPIQPPMLGAAIASVKLHMSDEILKHQNKLQKLIAYTNQKIASLGIPQFEETNSPLFFIPVGLPKTAYDIVLRMKNDAIFVNTASFPATPMKRGGVRFMINGNMTEDDIDALLLSLSRHYPMAISEHGSSPQKVAKAFGIPLFNIKNQVHNPTINEQFKTDVANLSVSHYKNIQEIDYTEWDYFMANRGNFNHNNLCLLQNVFGKQKEKENTWDFHYIQIKDRNNVTVLSTFYSVALIKDDMFAPGSVSKQIEAKRKKDPYYLNSTCVILGSLITKGDHLYLDKSHQGWRTALKLLIDEMQHTVDETGATQIMMREFEKEGDDELKNAFFDLGLTEVELLNLCTIDDISWNTEEEFLKQLGGKYRYNVRKEILPYVKAFDVVCGKPETQKEIEECYDLYCKVHKQAYTLNVHRLPLSFFESMQSLDQYDIIRLYLKDDTTTLEERKPIAVMYSFVEGYTYYAMIVGLDYDYIRSHNTYKQMLYQTLLRAKEIGCKKVDLAFTAELEKKKIGARLTPMVAFVQTMDHFNHTVIASYAK